MFFPVTIRYESSLQACDPSKDGVLIIGKLDHLKQVDVNELKCKFRDSFNDAHFTTGLNQLEGNSSLHLWFDSFTLATLSSKVTRHNSPSNPHALSDAVQKILPRRGKEYVTIVCERSGIFPLGAAFARNFPQYNEKKEPAQKACEIVVDFLLVGEDQRPLTFYEVECLTTTMQSIRLTASIVDKPCNVMHTDAFLQEAKDVANELQIKPVVIRGEELRERGFGGIYGVGKAAAHPPALVILSHVVEGATKNIAFCGKGIVYDTGGLSIKTKTGMPGMKMDCGGAAGVLGAFRSAVKNGFTENLHCVLCLAENAVGPLATRPDDVHHFYSGLTVEINNTDAEGRLVLGDGVAYAKKDLKCDIIIDMATLTGAQGIATGRKHAAILTNQEDWELACEKAGRSSGDLCHSVPFTPEFHFKEFKSEVADMKNSVKNRDNAQVSCAGLFIGSHIGFDFEGAWLHIDMASPVEFANNRATGWGVALLSTLFGKYSKNPLLKEISPDI